MFTSKTNFSIQTNSVDPDQTAPKGAVSSGSTLFATETYYCVAQSVTCLATDANLTADQGMASSIPARSHPFVEIDHEIISMVICSLRLIHSGRVVVSYKRKCVHGVLVKCLFKLAQEEVWLDEHDHSC